MAKKSKTQRAKASANRAAKKEQARIAAEQPVEEVVADPAEAEASKEGFLKRYYKTHSKKNDTGATKTTKSSSKSDGKPKKKRFQFFRDVKAEMKRVTWPTRQDVLRWSGVVVAALLFFGIYVAILDNGIITPILVALSGLGA